MNIQLPSENADFIRERFAVDCMRVTLDARGWQCTCTGETPGVHCAHIEQAQAFRLMRGVKRDDDTIELQLSAEELRALWLALPDEHSEARAVEPVPAPTRGPRQMPWTTALAAAAIAGISSCLTYLAIDRAQPLPAPEYLPAVFDSTPPLQPAAAQDASVKFVNPFDGTEVFEFPAGTSDADARDAVSKLLLNRARERLAAREKSAHPVNVAQRL